uniref:Uncharacterized protein n=1 Tax=Octopus bimaculoides TaxID=37653 RepID=A0A0L8IGT8_OCTBM
MVKYTPNVYILLKDYYYTHCAACIIRYVELYTRSVNVLLGRLKIYTLCLILLLMLRYTHMYLY